MRLLPYIFYLIVISFHEVIFRDATSIVGISIDLPALIVLTIALYKAEKTAVWFGFIVGVVMAAGNPVTMGYHALVLAALALITFHARERLNLDSFAAKLILIVGGVLIHNIVTILVIQPSEIVYQLWRFALPGTIYTGLVSIIFLFFLEGLVTGRRVRALF
jgi:rod shape-determining protein MreD